MDTQKLQEELSNRLKGLVKNLVVGASDDIEAFLAEIAKDTAEATMVGDYSLLDEMKDQVGLLMAKHRIRAARGSQELVKSVISALISGAVTVGKVAIKSALGSI